jgi:hypothetical protein
MSNFRISQNIALREANLQNGATVCDVVRKKEEKIPRALEPS